MSAENDPLQVSENTLVEKVGISPERAERAARLKAVREATGLTVDDFAREAGVTRKTQFQYEKGNTAPDADYLDRLHFKWAVDVGELVTGVPRAARSGFDAQTRGVAERFEQLPKLLRKTVDDVLQLAWMAYRDRKDYPLDSSSSNQEKKP